LNGVDETVQAAQAAQLRSYFYIEKAPHRIVKGKCVNITRGRAGLKRGVVEKRLGVERGGRLRGASGEHGADEQDEPSHHGIPLLGGRGGISIAVPC
jgi:hypothetical protein